MLVSGPKHFNFIFLFKKDMKKAVFTFDKITTSFQDEKF